MRKKERWMEKRSDTNNKTSTQSNARKYHLVFAFFLPLFAEPLFLLLLIRSPLCDIFISRQIFHATFARSIFYVLVLLLSTFFSYIHSFTVISFDACRCWMLFFASHTFFLPQMHRCAHAHWMPNIRPYNFPVGTIRCSLRFSFNTNFRDCPWIAAWNVRACRVRDSCGNTFLLIFRVSIFHFKPSNGFVIPKLTHSIQFHREVEQVYTVLSESKRFRYHSIQSNWSFDKSPICRDFRIFIHNNV